MQGPRGVRCHRRVSSAISGACHGREIGPVWGDPGRHRGIGRRVVQKGTPSSVVAGPMRAAASRLVAGVVPSGARPPLGHHDTWRWAFPGRRSDSLTIPGMSAGWSDGACRFRRELLPPRGSLQFTPGFARGTRSLNWSSASVTATVAGIAREQYSGSFARPAIVLGVSRSAVVQARMELVALAHRVWPHAAIQLMEMTGRSANRFAEPASCSCP